MKTLLKNHWQQISAVLIAIPLALWAISCQPTVPSLTDPTHRVTRGELQIELEALQATFEMRSEQLTQRELLRKLILDNALLLADNQNYNPLGILTGIAALYGIGSATKDTSSLVKRKLKQQTAKPTWCSHHRPRRRPPSNHRCRSASHTITV